MKNFAVRIGVFAVLLLAFGMNLGWAQEAGATSIELAQGLYCSGKGLLEGDVGLMIGLILVFTGLWGLVQGGKIIAALPVMVIGALMTALPSLVEASLSGLGALLNENHISESELTLPTCGGDATGNSGDAAMDKRYTNPQTGTFYPSRGDYQTPKNVSGSPDDRDGL